GFSEFSRRAGDFAIAMALVTYRLEGGVIAGAHVGLGGAEAVPRRISEAEEMLNGKTPAPELFAAAGAVAAAAIDPIDDSNNPVEYRRALVHTLVGRALSSAA